MTAPEIRHVLLDADEVLQHTPVSLEAAAGQLAERVSPELRADLWALEWPALRGEIDFFAESAAIARRHGAELDPAELFTQAWRSIVVDPDSTALVARLRVAGYGVHLGTNQEHHRARFMRADLGFDDGRFDVAVYSCDIGLAKPDPAYFDKAVAMIGAEPGSVLFVDDRQENVDGARSAGLVAERWELADGHAVLRELLAGHGVLVHG
ncbi:HAD-IA family hydrolase [Nocardioides sp. W7]|uniref:HAD-IA family hydrolase n=1 Tax=Nocardioides sp. W7 TaxID=2931390 RepID=UPI001FD1EC02|nr:HAD-IA family hydrolase [Nocardioides sp. W7]